MGKTNGWSRYEKLVLSELQDVKSDMLQIKTTINLFSTRMAVVELKSGVWGALAGFVAALPTAIAVMRYLKP